MEIIDTILNNFSDTSMAGLSSITNNPYAIILFALAAILVYVYIKRKIQKLLYIAIILCVSGYGSAMIHGAKLIIEQANQNLLTIFHLTM